MKVKALSFRQPWAELVLQGKKTLDLRTWSTRYRGPLAIYASQTVEKEACRDHGIDPKQLTTGAVIGLVNLVGVVELDQAAYVNRADEHLGNRHFQGPLFGWELANPRPLAEPVSTRGHFHLFDINLPEKQPSPTQATKQTKTHIPLPTLLITETWWGSHLPFELRIIPEKSPRSSYRLALYQRRVEPPPAQHSLYCHSTEQMDRVVELGGVALQAVADQGLEALRQNGYKATDLTLNRGEPFTLQEEWGVRLGLLFLAVKPVSKVNRIESISAGIRKMTSEEVYYWYSKCTSPAIKRRAQQALRILLTKE